MMTLAILRVLGWSFDDAKELILQQRYVVDFAECLRGERGRFHEGL